MVTIKAFVNVQRMENSSLVEN